MAKFESARTLVVGLAAALASWATAGEGGPVTFTGGTWYGIGSERAQEFRADGTLGEPGGPALGRWKVEGELLTKSFGESEERLRIRAVGEVLALTLVGYSPDPRGPGQPALNIEFELFRQPATRWQTPDGELGLVLPQGWAAAVEATAPDLVVRLTPRKDLDPGGRAFAQVRRGLPGGFMKSGDSYALELARAVFPRHELNSMTTEPLDAERDLLYVLDPAELERSDTPAGTSTGPAQVWAAIRIFKSGAANPMGMDGLLLGYEGPPGPAVGHVCRGLRALEPSVNARH